MTPPELEPRRYCRTFEELRHVAAEPDELDTPSDLFDVFGTLDVLVLGATRDRLAAANRAASIEYLASLTTNN